MADDYSYFFEKMEDLESDNLAFANQIKQLIATVGILTERVNLLSANAGIATLDMEPIE